MINRILGLGTATPQRTISQEELARHVNRITYGRTPSQMRLLRSLFKSTEIQSRGSVLLNSSTETELVHGEELRFYREALDDKDNGPTTRERMSRYIPEASAMALEAAQKALTDAQVTNADITHLITVSCTGFFSPGIDVHLIKQMGLSPEITRLHVGFMGCHGAINGLRAAHAIALSDPDATVLLCAVELCSLHFQYGWDRDQIVSNSLFADGAAALIFSSKPANDAGPADWHVRATGSYLFPDSEDAMSWHIGDHGFEMTLSSRVPDLIGGSLEPWLTRWLAKHGSTTADIRSWAIHPGGPRILSAVEESLKLSESDMLASRQILAKHGNMSSPTVVFILEELRKMKAPKPCVVLGFGPGLVAEAALLD